ncbi:4'-phosphopantetheinyl transferase superfamily [Cladochytrium replicatum]|nr:4'-phosphopantetheinyl transferase superfamily [Cladochytrium replicatum]
MLFEVQVFSIFCTNAAPFRLDGSSKMSRSVGRWKFNVNSWNPSEKEFATALAWVHDKTEQTRILRFIFEVDRKRALIGQILGRYAVARVLESLGEQHAINEIELERTENGKPYLSKPKRPEIAFNISHDGDWVVAVASSLYTELGVDVTSVHDTRGENHESFLETFHSYFTTVEWSQIREKGDSSDQAVQKFFRFWGLKEAYTKALGLGLGVELLRIEFVQDGMRLVEDREDSLSDPDTSIVVRLDGEVRSSWKFEVSYLDPAHTVAVAFNTEGRNAEATEILVPGIGFHDVVFEDLERA